MPIRQDTLRERWLAQQQYSQNTQRSYRQTLKAFQRRFDVYAERVTPAMLVDFLVTDEDGEPTTRAPSSLRKDRATLRTFWRWCYRNGYVRADPTETLDDLKLGSGERRPGHWLTHSDAMRLLESARCCPTIPEVGERNYAIVATALLTGLRRAELSEVRWRDLDIAQRRLNVRGKGDKLAIIGLPDQAATSLHQWRETLMACRGGKPNGGDPAFPTGHTCNGLRGTERTYVWDWQRPLSPWSIANIVRRSAEDAGLGMIGTHDLRRSFAGFLEQRGTDLAAIQAAMRHATPHVTVRHYLDKSPRRAIEAVKDLTIEDDNP